MSLDVITLKKGPRTSNVLAKNPMRNNYLIIGIIIAVLCLLIIFKPTIKREFHANYLKNIKTLDSLSYVLVRDYLLVRHGQVRHYDFLELDLQNMEKAAQLLPYVPIHVGPQIDIAAKRLSDDYLSQLDSIRNYVELSKRSIGLLRNSKSLLTVLADRLTGELALNADSSIDSVEWLIALDLINSINAGGEITRIHKLIDKLAESDNISHQLLTQIRLHTGMVASYAKLLDEADIYIFEHADALIQPQEINELYLNRHNVVSNRNSVHLIIICSLVFCIIMIISIHALRRLRGRHKAGNKLIVDGNSANNSLHDLDKAA